MIVQIMFLILIYLMFLLSGAAGLIYEVIWFRSLSLIFGGSHLAVTTVLSVFMAGLALGSYIIGRNVHRFSRLLRLYGLLELGIALSAGIFILLIKLYPAIYIPLARISSDSPAYLSIIRVVFSVAALIIPTTLMGGTLPVLSGLMAERGKGLGGHLSFLYGFNTLGAVAGAVGAGFFLIRYFSVNLALLFPVLINITVGMCAIILQGRIKVFNRTDSLETEPLMNNRPHEYIEEESRRYRFSLKLVLWGIGASGFCALGYEVLWTRLLILILGASFYGFTVMLAAFLTGIGLGSSAYGFIQKILHSLYKRNGSPLKAVVGFGLVQIMIGVTAILATDYFFDLPALSVELQQFLKSTVGSDIFSTWQWASFGVAFLFMFIPAFFMGLAFPLAGEIHATYKKVVGHAVGEILAFNTVGALLGAAISGYALIYLVGIERALQILSLVNIGYGLFVITSTRNNRIVNTAVPAFVLAIILLLSFSPNAFKVLDPGYFVIYQSNRPDLFSTRERVDRILKGIKVLYHAEGAESIVSSYITPKGVQQFTTNGLAEASNMFEDMQCQYTLGHLPMLLNKNPRKVLVIGLGSGMTAGATSIHPSVEEITLVEIEPKVVGVAETFAFYNHNILHNPKLKLVFNDGRNYLLTTTNTFDVITADPIHPFFRGAGYLYTTEYFKLASEHLSPGGVMCQWLPLYRLNTENVISIVKTFSQNFKYTMLWQTVYDVELIGSNSPIRIDEIELERRISNPAISFDMQWVVMGSADDFLSYFFVGPKGVKVLTEGGVVNTDQNLYLEFSAPYSFNSLYQEGANIRALLGGRESIMPYLVVPSDPAARNRQRKIWNGYERLFPLVDEVHTMMLKGNISSSEFRNLIEELDKKAPTFAPWMSLRGCLLRR
jgi:spermidine synthase